MRPFVRTQRRLSGNGCAPLAAPAWTAAAHLNRRTVLQGLLAAPFVLLGGPASAVPQRVVALEYMLAEQMIVLGAPPLGLTDANQWNQWVAEPPLPASTVDIGAALAPNVELLAALHPDLVLSTDFTAVIEEQVGRFAPVERFSVYSEGGSPLPKAVAAMRRMGVLLGREAEAEAYLAETERFFDACAARVRRFSEKPILLLVFIDPRHVRVSSRPGLQQDVLDRLGLQNAWTKDGLFWGFSTVGIEGLAEVGDATVMASYMPDDVRFVLERSPLWQALPFRRGNRPIPVLPTVSSFGGVPAARRLAGLLADTLEGFGT